MPVLEQVVNAGRVHEGAAVGSCAMYVFAGTRSIDGSSGDRMYGNTSSRPAQRERTELPTRGLARRRLPIGTASYKPQPKPWP